MVEYPHIVLCATQRCGSTLVVEDMRNTGVLGNPEEWFVSWCPDKKDVDWADALSTVRKRATGQNGVMAIKVMADQLLKVEECLKGAIKPPPGPRYFRFHKAFENAVWVKLNRRNLAAQSISRLMAHQTGVNHATATGDQEHFAGNLLKGYSDSYNERATYNYDAILREATAITLENLAWDNFFRDFGITPIELNYESVVKDPDMRHLDLFAEAIGLTTPPSRKPRTMVKVGNQRNKDFEAQFMREAAARSYR